MRKLSAILLCLWLMSVAATAQPSVSAAPSDSTPATASAAPAPVQPVAKRPEHNGGIHWKSLMEQWWLNLVMDQTVRIAKEPKTRAALSGPFVQDWLTTVSTYNFTRWNDDDKFITSNLGHPMQGAIVAAIFWQNDDHVRFSDQDFHNPAYRKALFQAFLFTTFDAVQWKLGPISESSIGNVGLPAHWWDKYCSQINIPCEERTGLNDLVLNETGGILMTVGFQWLDKHVQKRLERHVQNRTLIDTTRMLTNPPQAVANIVRFRPPWYRDNRQ